MDKLRTLRFFAAVSSQGSFIDAAKIFGTSPSTISKAISRLENDLGITLFTRTTRALALTKAGEDYLYTVKKILLNLDGAESNLKNELNRITGKLVINTPMSYGRLYLRPLIAQFCRLHPSIEIELIYDDAYIDTIDKNIDITFRTGTVADSRLIARKLSPIDFVICAPASYFTENSDTKNANISHELLLNNPWINFRFKQTGKLMPIMLRDKKKQFHEHYPRSVCIIDDGEALAELCADGLGLAQMPHFIARKELLKQTIKVVSPLYSPRNYGVFALYAKAEKTPPKITAFIDFVQQWLRSIGEDSSTTWARDSRKP